MNPSLPLLGTLFDSLPVGLVVLDARGQVVIYNRVEEQLAARSRAKVIGQDFFADIAPCMNVKELGERFRDRLGTAAMDVTVEMSFPFPHAEQPRDVRVRMASMQVGDDPFAFLIIEDISLMRQVEAMREKLQSLLVHDMKNPLMAITGNIQYVQELQTVRDHQDAREALDDALDAARRLNRMTVNLLDLARLESATMPIRRSPTDLVAMFARVINDNRAAARLNGCRLEAATTVTSVVSVDEDLVARALDNLIENALRHAKHVTLDAELMPDAVLIRVIDDGPGIPVHMQQRLFDRYVQVVDPTAARGANRGLGLTFVQLVAREHGGDVSVSCPPSGGTVFTLRFPISGS